MTRLDWQDTNDGPVYHYPNKEEPTHRIRIVPDSDPLNPRTEYDNVCTMLCWHRRYNLGDSNNVEKGGRHVSWPSEYKDRQELEDAFKGAGGVVIQPLYLYDHSGLTIGMSPFSCPWDSGQIGWIICPYAQANSKLLSKPLKNPSRSATLHQKILDCMKAEVETYDQYLQGDVWGYVIEEATQDRYGLGDNDDCETEWEQLDSCFGFYGLDHCKEQAVDVLLRHVIDSHKQPDGTFADVA